MDRFDYVLVGGGLQSALLALALRARRPGATIALAERAATLGGNHTWCFHEGDVPPGAQWHSPLVVRRWPGYQVMFPALERTIHQPYSCITSDRLHSVVSRALRDHDGSRLLLETEVTEIGPDHVRLRSGRDLRATVVVDARGPSLPQAPAQAGYQKFVGLELQLARPHDVSLPILMDAVIEQGEGFRFMYVLPLAPQVLLVENTYFHDSPELCPDRERSEIRRYASERGWEIAGVRREEQGVLPMPWADSFRSPDEGPLVAGYRGGWFHPGTGYSFPVALRLAEYVASRPAESVFSSDFVRLAREHARQVGFAQVLNRLLFRWYPPQARSAIFERFYRMPCATIENFYALRLRRRDRMRLLFGRPPRGLSIRHRLQAGTPK